jgi:hypothetical protein
MLYSRGIRFESRPKHRLPWLIIFMVILSPFRQITGRFPWQTTTAFFRICSTQSSVMYHPIIRRYIVTILKMSLNNLRSKKRKKQVLSGEQLVTNVCLNQLKDVVNSYTRKVKSILIDLLNITPCSPLKVNRRFGGTYRLHLRILRTHKRNVLQKRRLTFEDYTGLYSGKYYCS